MEVVVAAVHQNGKALRYASKELRANEEIALAAVMQNGQALRYVCEKFKKDEQFVMSAVQLSTLQACKHKSWGEYLRIRYKSSTLRKYMDGSDISYEEIDAAVNTIAVVCALVLTIPFSILGNLGYEFWDFYKEVSPDTLCWVYNLTFNTLNGIILSSVTSIILTVFYYILRPRQAFQFLRWWHRGKWVLVAMFIGGTIAVSLTLSLCNTLIGAQYYYRSTDEQCPSIIPGQIHYNVSVGSGMFILVLATILSFFTMI